MSAITDAYADYEANRGLYQSESPTFDRGARGRPPEHEDDVTRLNQLKRSAHRIGPALPADIHEAPMLSASSKQKPSDWRKDNRSV